MTQTTDYDAVVVGAGFGGIYELIKLRDQLGLSVKVIDKAEDVGGTWFWNRYPGVMSDTESYLFRFTWDKELLQTYPWPNHYVTGEEVLKYLSHVVDKYNLRKDMLLGVGMESAVWEVERCQWRVGLDNGHVITARYLITALGLLSTPNYPDIPGIDTFKGRLVHTSRWSPDIAVDDKRIGVIGNGSTGIQVITALSPRAKTLTSFQRHPQYSVPSGNRPAEPEYREWVNTNYDKIIEDTKNSLTAFGVPESTEPYASVPPEQREQRFEDAWRKGNGFRFMFSAFSDITTNREANEAACDFIRRKIASIVKDPEKARKLQPRDPHARRPLCDSGYYQQFNRESVSIVDVKETPIETIVPEGIRTADGTVHEFDLIVFATGFDAVEGSYNRVRIQGRGGETVRDHWDEHGPISYMGVALPGFPNMFMVLGPQGPFSNNPPAIEREVELHTALIARTEEMRRTHGPVAIEASREAEDEWAAKCEKAAEGSLFSGTASWIFGNNVKGKRVALRFYLGGVKSYIDEIQSMISGGFRGFKFYQV